MNYKLIEESALAGGCSVAEAIWAVSHLFTDELVGLTTKLREAAFGNKVWLCEIMNARCGCCPEDCTFCAQSAHNQSEITLFGFRENKDIIAKAAAAGRNQAHNFGIVTSGVTVKGEALEHVCMAISEIAEVPASPGVCASFGRMNREQLEELKAAGLERYHHNLETAESFYPRVCTTHGWVRRLETVQIALAVGLKVCSGGLFGLGEGWQERADLALVLRELGVDSVPLNFLHAHPGTPLAGQPPLKAEEALRIIALYRLLLPRATIRVCGGRPKILGHRMQEMFRYGANAFMTGDYLTTSGITPQSDLKMIEEEGLILAE